jgi:hypothetical protein
MTSNDAQIDVLLRRYARQSQSNSATEHLDADELNAFAEGSLPEGARARYVSHLVDCDNCRQIVSQLAISSGAVIAAEATTAGDPSGYSWWKRLSGFLSPLTLRYAAFAMVLIAVAGVVFLIRRPRESNLVAQNEQTKLGPVSAVKPPNETMPPAGSKSESVGNENKQALASRPGPSLQSSPSSGESLRLDASKSGDTPASPPKPAKEAEGLSSPSLVAGKKAEAVQTETVPSYAPPPPGAGQRAETQSRQQQNVAGIASASGPRQSQQQPADVFKMPDRGRADVSGKDNREDDKSLAANQPLARKRAGDEKAKGPRRDMENNSATNRNSNELRDEVNKSQGVVNAKPAASASEEKPPETRSAGGRKFKRQGSLWVDAKFKSSMTLKSISRGSSEFDSLDSGLRSIAQQLGGEVIVVWKNKAYLIK